MMSIKTRIAVLGIGGRTCCRCGAGPSPRKNADHARVGRQDRALLSAADHRGAAWAFQEQGLDVTINDFRGGAQSLQALVGGSARRRHWAA